MWSPELDMFLPGASLVQITRGFSALRPTELEQGDLNAHPTAAQEVGAENAEAIFTLPDITDVMTELIKQALHVYLASYNEKEGLHLKQQFRKLVINTIDEPSLIRKIRNGVSVGRESISQLTSAAVNKVGVSLGGANANTAAAAAASADRLPQIAAERFRDLVHLEGTIGNEEFVTQALQISDESLRRLIRIGKGDKYLSSHIREVYHTEVRFLSDCVFNPWLACLNSQIQNPLIPPQ